MSDLHTRRCRECRGTGRSGSTPSGHYRCEDCDGAGRVTVCLDCDEHENACRCEPEPEIEDAEDDASPVKPNAVACGQCADKPADAINPEPI
jgi:hypothetical protein